MRPFRCGLLLVLGLSGVAFSRSLVRERAAAEKISELPWLAEMDPLDFLGTTALGGLRPLVIDLLWMRVSDAFARKDWYDALPLTELICRLQPNLPTVWEHNSWNMAYNISASKLQAGRPEEAFQWVQEGIQVQKKAVAKIPDSSEVRDWLAWLYFFKCRTEDYLDRFEACGVDPLEEAIRAGREANRLEKRDHRVPQLFGLYLSERIREIQESGEEGPEAKAELASLAQEAVDAFELCLERSPKVELRGWQDFRMGIADRISSLRKVLERAKDSAWSPTKESGGR